MLRRLNDDQEDSHVVCLNVEVGWDCVHLPSIGLRMLY